VSLEHKTEQRKAVVLAHLELAFADITRSVESGWIDQEFSPLGSRRHIAAVRRRVARRKPGAELDAAIVGRRYLLSIDALAEEYFRPVPRRVRLKRALRALLRAKPANCNGVSS